METKEISTASTTLEGYITQIRIGAWNRSRKVKIDSICISVEISTCWDCDRCRRRIKTISDRLCEKEVTHLWVKGWLVVPHKGILKHTEGEKTWKTSDPLKYLSEVLMENCTEVCPSE